MAEDGFVFTDHMVTVSNQLWAVTSGVGAVLCFFVLIAIFGLGMHRSSRVHLDRVSFRLLKWALLANMFFGIFSAIGGMMTEPGFLCGFSIFVLQLTLEFSCFLLFSIALNLQLVVVHHINGINMEKYYIIGSAVLALGLTVPTYASKQYGWDPLVEDCWYTNDNRRQRLAWQIGTQLLWTGLTVIGEVGASVTVILYMIKHQVHRRNLGVTSVHSSTDIQSRSNTRTGTSAPSAIQRALKPVDHANAYKGIIFRIALYPLTSCVINLTSIMCVIHATVADGVHNTTDYNILLLSDFLYGGRAVVYALLAATDPALLRAVRAFISHMLGRPFPSSSYGSQGSGWVSTFKASASGGGRSGDRSRASASVSHTHPVLISVELDTIVSPPDRGISYSERDIDLEDGEASGMSLSLPNKPKPAAGVADNHHGSGDEMRVVDDDGGMVNRDQKISMEALQYGGSNHDHDHGDTPAFQSTGRVMIPVDEEAERRRLFLDHERIEEGELFQRQI